MTFNPTAVIHKWQQSIPQVGLDDQTAFLDETYRMALGETICHHRKAKCSCHDRPDTDVEGVPV